MPYAGFHSLFPNVAEKETRKITLMEGHGLDLPAWDYSFLEMFCDEKGCDCRRVMFSIVSSRREGILAVVGWGWEDDSFYGKWLGRDDRHLIEEMKGRCLNLASPQSDLAQALLYLTENRLLKDKAYRDRIKRHYRMFRKEIDRPKKRR